ncbi:CHC2 zinc finger domain-containing protein [Clostridium sp.]|uniref:CHC2 zinc finger domain-containing protein n=1 Tax=Clostridium sp. TaxID=1506 RepID=UPI00304FEDE6
MSNLIDKYKVLFDNNDVDYTESDSNLYVHCPFHNDKRASLVVNKENGWYNCFSTNCNLRGGTYYTLEEKMKELG